MTNALTTTGGKGTAARLYEHLVPTREPYLRRARTVASLTIAHYYPPAGFMDGQDLPVPYTEIGGEAVRTLAAKTTLAMFPPHSPVGRFMPPPEFLMELSQMGEQGIEAREIMDKALAEVERLGHDELEKANIRVEVEEAVGKLLVGGNILSHLPKDDHLTVQVYGLDQFVVRRSPHGKVMDIVLEEFIDVDLLPDDTKDWLTRSEAGGDKPAKGLTNAVAAYTHIRRKVGVTPETFEVYQEVAGKVLEGSEAEYEADELPWAVATTNRGTGQTYGRPHAGFFLGDLASADDLAKAILEATKAAARYITLVDPTGLTNAYEMDQAENLSTIAGREVDVGVPKANKTMDLQSAQMLFARAEQRISRGFLMVSSVQRDAERVTAEEIRRLTAELEEVLGGTYATLAREFLGHMYRTFMRRLMAMRKIPSLPRDFDPVPIAGMETLGRGNDAYRLQIYSQSMTEMFGPERVAQEVDLRKYSRVLGKSIGFDGDSILMTQQEAMAARQQAEMQHNVDNLGPKAIETIGRQQQQQPQE